jgi:Arc/MetJ family transcription regulator
MRTTVDISIELLEKAQSILKTETKKETIEKALEQILQWHERQNLIQYRGKIDLDIDLNQLRNRT